jgi:hypothetical protein
MLEGERRVMMMMGMWMSKMVEDKMMNTML